MLIGARKELTGMTGDKNRMTGNLISADDFATGWGAVNSTVSTDAVVAPSGGQTADLVIPGGTSVQNHMVQYNFNITTANILYTFRIRAKAYGYQYVEIILSNNSGFSKFFAPTFDVKNCTVGNTRGATYSGFPSIKKLSNGWRLIDIPLIPALDANSTHGIEMHVSSILQFATAYTGDLVSGMAFWGAELCPTAQ